MWEQAYSAVCHKRYLIILFFFSYVYFQLVMEEQFGKIKHPSWETTDMIFKSPIIVTRIQIQNSYPVLSLF